MKFRYDVEVLEFTKDPYEDQLLITDSELSRAKQQQQQAGAVSNMIVVCVTCVAAIAVTVVLPWFLIGSALALVLKIPTPHTHTPTMSLSAVGDSVYVSEECCEKACESLGRRFPLNPSTPQL